MFKFLMFCAICGLIAAFPAGDLDNAENDLIVYIKIAEGIEHAYLDEAIPEAVRIPISYVGNGRFNKNHLNDI